MLAIVWMYGYVLIQAVVPESFTVAGSSDRPLTMLEILYFSATVLTSTGFGDVVPVTGPARGLVIVEEIVGVLFVAILIARLAGIYPPARNQKGLDEAGKDQL
jgi:Ion channel